MNDFTYFGEEVDEDIAEVEVEDTPATTKNTKPVRIRRCPYLHV